jgi:serine/threonine-protein kinase RsbW
MTPGSITLRIRRDARQIVITVEDDAPYFDPSSIRPADPDAPLDRRSVGGLGWHFVTRLMDQTRHERRHPHGNRLTLVKRLTHQS